MRILERLLGEKSAFVLVKAHAVDARHVVFAVEAFVHATKEAATCIVSVNTETLAYELVHEAVGSSIDYAYVDGWHGLLQRDFVIELAGGNANVTEAGLGDGTLLAIGRAGDTTVVCGNQLHGRYANDGFAARVVGGKLERFFVSSKDSKLCPLGTLSAGPRSVLVGGIQQANLEYRVFRGDTKAVTPLPGGIKNSVTALHETASGTVMIGCRFGAAVHERGVTAEITNPVGEYCGLVELGGVEHWFSFADDIMMWKRTGTKLAKKAKTKLRDIGYRRVHGAPEARVTAAHERIVITNGDRIHLYDGKKWSQLALQRNVKKLVKRLPAGMKA